MTTDDDFLVKTVLPDKTEIQQTSRDLREVFRQAKKQLEEQENVNKDDRSFHNRTWGSE